jgi:hypothetical protein
MSKKSAAAFFDHGPSINRQQAFLNTRLSGSARQPELICTKLLSRVSGGPEQCRTGVARFESIRINV